MAGYSGTSEPAALAVASIVCSDWDRAKLDFQFVDMTAASGLDALNGVVLGAAFVDLDQGGDLDLIAARYSDSPTSALKALQDENAANHSPNLNSCLERFWRSLREECLDRMIFFGEDMLRRTVCSYIGHYHRERNHQGLENQLIEAGEEVGRKAGDIQCREHLGGLLRYYYRQAA